MEEAPHPAPECIARIARRAHNAKAAKERHDTAYYAWEASVRLAVAARPPEDARGLALASLGTWVQAARLGADGIADPALLAALALFSETGLGKRAAPRSVSPRRLLDALPPYRNAVIGHGAPRDEAFYEAAAGTLLAALEAAWAHGVFWERGARLVSGDDADARAALAPEAAPALVAGHLCALAGGRATSLHPWLLAHDGDLGPRALFFNGRARTTQYLDFVSGEPLRGAALHEAFPDLEPALVRVFGEPRRGGSRPWPQAPEDAPAAGVESGYAPDRTPDPDAEPAPDDPTRMGGYRIVAPLGEGGMGVVHLAVEESLGRRVALKRMREGSLSDDVARRRFRREVAALARVDHPNVVKVLASGEARHTPYYAMELVEGADLAAVGALLGRGHDLDEAVRRASAPLRARLTGSAAPQTAPEAASPGPRDGTETARRLAALAADAARGLHALHEAGIVHRDVKPHNIMVTSAGSRAVVMDLGLAAVADASRSLTREAGGIAGTLRYVSPERLERGDRDVDRRADIYGLGATLYELLAGRPAFEGESEAHLLRRILHDAPPRLRSVASDVPPDLAVIVEKAIAREPGRRYQTAEALAQDLDAFLDGRPISARAPTFGYVVGLAIRRNKALAAVALACALLVLAAPFALSEARSRAALEAAREARRELVAAARKDTAQALIGLDVRRSEAAPSTEEARRERADRLLALGLGALTAAERAAALDPEDPAAAADLDRAARILGHVALEAEQWSVAASAFEAALRSGVDEPGARAAIASIERARTAKARARREEVERILADAGAGKLDAVPGAAEDAVFRLVALGDAQTVALLGAAVDGVASDLRATARETWLAAATPTADEALGGLGPIEGLAEAIDRAQAVTPGAQPRAEDAARIAAAEQRIVARTLGSRPNDRGVRIASGRELVAFAQTRGLGVGGARVASLASEALGRIGIIEGAAPAILRLFAAEHDAARALVPMRALLRLADPTSVQGALAIGIRRFGARGGFMESMSFDLQRSPHARAILRPSTGPRAQTGAAARGAEAQTRGDFAAAEEEFTRALEARPDDLFLLAQRAHVRMSLSDRQGALEDAERFLAQRPDDIPALVLRGQAWRFVDPAAAMADAERVMALDPAFAGAWLLRALLRHDRGEADAALADAERALALDPAGAEACFVRGLIRSSKGANDDALRDLDRAIVLEPGNPRNHVTRGNVRLDLGDREGALVDYARAIELQPESATFRMSRGRAHLLVGRLDEALSDYERAIQLDPGAALAWSGRANVRLKKEDLAGAVEDASRAIDLDPARPVPFRTRGSALSRLGRHAEAIADLRRAAALDSRDPSTWQTLGVMLSRARDLEEAVEAYGRAITLDPKFKGALLARSMALENLGRLEESLADADRAVAADPRAPEAKRRRASALLALRRFEESSHVILETLRTSPRDFFAWEVLGLAREGLLDFAGARDAYSKALELKPRNAYLWNNRGYARFRSGDREGALADVEKALALDPACGPAFDTRGEVKLAVGDTAGAIADFERCMALDADHPAARLHRGFARIAAGDEAGGRADLEAFLAVQGIDAPSAKLAREALARPVGAGARLDAPGEAEKAPAPVQGPERAP